MCYGCGLDSRGSLAQANWIEVAVAEEQVRRCSERWLVCLRLTRAVMWAWIATGRFVAVMRPKSCARSRTTLAQCTRWISSRPTSNERFAPPFETSDRITDPRD